MLCSVAYLAFRVIVGGIFAIHGYTKLFGGPGKPISPVAERYLGAGFVQQLRGGSVSRFGTALQGLGVPFPQLLAWVSSLVEFGGGILMMFGLLTRPAALLLAGNMFVAIQKVGWRNGLIGPRGFQDALVLLASCLGLIGAGPGEISLDHQLVRQRAARQRKAQRPVLLAVGLLSLGALVARLNWPVARPEASVPTSVDRAPI